MSTALPEAVVATFFTDYTAALKREERVPLHELARQVQTMVAAEKGRLPWLKLARFGAARSVNNSLRHDGNVLAITGIEADYDGEVVSFDQAVETVEKAGLGGVVYTSPSHGPDKPRWRVLCPLSRELPPGDRYRLVARLNGLFGGIFASESFTLSQSYYYGKVFGAVEHRVEVIDGEPIDLLDELDDIAIGRPNGQAPHEPEDGVRADAEGADIFDVFAALAVIPNKSEADWNEWTRIGLAICAATNGSAAGGVAFDTWSRKNPVYDGAVTRERWEHIVTHPPDRIGAGTLFYLAKQARSGDASDYNRRTSTFYSAATLKDRPVAVRPWLVPDLVPMNTVTLFSGDGGTGKSLLALQLAVAVAAAESWLARTVNRGRAIVLSAEDDDDELHRRLDSVLRATGLGYDDIAGLTLRSVAGEDALLAVEEKLVLTQSALFHELEARAADDQPSLIAIDTLADVFPANENDRAKVRQFVGLLRGLALRHHCAVMLLAHPSLTGLNSGTGTSGSTGWNNSVRSRLYLERIVQDGYEPDPDTRVLTTKKSNYARIGSEISMRWKDGVFVADQPEGVLDVMAATMKAERVFLSLLREMNHQGRRVNPSAGGNYAPKVFLGHPNSEGCTKRVLAGAMERLLKNGKIVVKHEGPPSRRVSYLDMAGSDD